MKCVKLLIITSLVFFTVARQINPPACPGGHKQNSKEITVNGCGPQGKSLGKKILEGILKVVGKDFQSSCDDHDRCFGTCVFSADHFKKCNDDFYDSMKAACKKKHPNSMIPRGICIVKAKVFFSAVNGSVGKKVYQSSQTDHCECPSRRFRLRHRH